MAGFYREGELGKGQPTPGLEMFMVGEYVSHTLSQGGAKGLRRTWQPGTL